MLNITKGNPIPLRVILSVDDSPFPVVNATDISCSLQAMFGTFACEWQHGEEDNELYVDGAATLPSGVYGLEVKGKLNGIPWRTFTPCVVKVTYATEQGDNSPVVPSADIYDVKMEVQLYKSASSDEKIAEHNADKAAHPYIQGLLDDKVDKEAGKGLSTNDYTDEDEQKVAGLVGLPVCEGVTAANFFGYGGDWDATFCSLRVRWNHDYELDMEDIMLGIDDDVQNGFELALNTDDSSVIASHRNELKVSFDLPSEAAAYSGDFAEMSVKIFDNNGVEIERLLMSDELKVKPGYHYTLLLSLENGRLILDHKRYKLPKV